MKCPWDKPMFNTCCMAGFAGVCAWPSEMIRAGVYSYLSPEWMLDSAYKALHTSGWTDGGRQGAGGDTCLKALEGSSFTSSWVMFGCVNTVSLCNHGWLDYKWCVIVVACCIVDKPEITKSVLWQQPAQATTETTCVNVYMLLAWYSTHRWFWGRYPLFIRLEVCQRLLRVPSLLAQA